MRYKNDYKNYKNITVEPISHGKAVIVGIFLLIITLVVNKSDLSKSIDTKDIYPYIFYGFLIFSRLISLPFIYKISKKIGKDVTLYCLLGIISPGIVLIILGFSDIKLESKVATKIVASKRQEYRFEIDKLKLNGNKSDLTKELEEIKSSKNNELLEELTKYYRKN